MKPGHISLVVAVLVIASLTCAFLLPAYAQETYRWQVNYQHVALDIDSSGQVYMTYQVDATIQKGVWNEVWIPATTDNMQVTSVVDGTGASHNFFIDKGDRQIKTQGYDLRPGDRVNLVVKSTLPGFVYKAREQGYAIVEFIPPWWDMVIRDTQVKYVLPADINNSEVFTGNRQYSGIGTEDGRTIVYFNSTSLGNNERFDTAVSFPDRYMAPGAVTSSAPGGIALPVDVDGIISGIFGTGCCGVWIIVPIAIFLIITFISASRRSGYSSPVLGMSGMGVNQNLDPVEAGMLLRVDPRRILTMIMFGLMKKGNVKLISSDPLRLELASRKDMNYYEALFSDAIKGDALDEDRLLKCFKMLAQRVVDKTRPYSRKETEEFYRQKIEDAWKDVQALDTPELKLQKYDTNMFWLMADEAFTAKTTDSLRSPGWGTVAVPPYYWWYPYYFGLPRGTPAPSTGQPQTLGTGRPTNQTTSSVEAFAKNFTSSVEKTSAGVVAGVESFVGVRNAANAPPPAGAAGGAPRSSCVSCACACAHCACACACAGGGGGCT